ncbi:UNVERIFIED_CONTAM: Beta,beta-carotene 15,15'-dioxygenase [Trichonephila clavipes]
MKYVASNIPDWVEGQLFRLGPAKWDFDKGFSFNHWLDGSALMYKFAIRKGHVDVMSKFLDTIAYQKLTQIQRPVFTEFGTKSYPDPCKNVFSRFFSTLVPLELTDNNIANVFMLDDELYASSETCHIWKINPNDLTCGFERASILTSISSTHKTCFSYYHSFGLTENYILFLEQPLLVNTVRMAASGIKGYSLKDCFDWNPSQKTRFHLIDRVSGHEIKTKYQSDAFFFFHHINTYEEDGHVIADIQAFPDPEVLDKFYLNKLRLGEFAVSCQPVFTRYILPLKALT